MKSRKHRSPRRRPHRRSVGQQLEVLEDRTLLAVIVDTLDDEMEDSSTTSLREAIALAAENPGDDTVTFAPSLAGPIHLTLGSLVISDSSAQITMEGTPGVTTISGATLVIEPEATAEIIGLTISGSPDRGIANGGTLTLTDSTVSENLGGGIDNSEGTLTLIGSTVSDNSYTLDVGIGEGGGIWNSGVLTLIDSTVSGNTAEVGGGISNFGEATLIDSTVTGNSQTHDFFGGGGIWNRGTLTLNRSTVSGNTANVGGGISNEGEATLIDSTVTGNSQSGSFDGGGGIRNWGTLTLNRSTVSHNSAGGGISSVGGVLTLIDSTVSHNRNDGDGGGIYTRDHEVTLIRSTISDNSAGSHGGGIFQRFFADSMSLNITDSTISGNLAGRRGGGVHLVEAFRNMLHGSTVANNSADSGGGIYAQNANLSLQDSIVADNYANSGPDLLGFALSWGHNLIQDSTGSTGFWAVGDLSDVDAKLGPLTDNGGFTWTHALLPDSPAIDAADTGRASETDQRGTLRPQGSDADIGAFESESFGDSNPFVTLVSLNGDLPDPANLSSGDQPTSWRQQRSDVRSMQVSFSKDVVAGAADVRLVNLGIDADDDENQPVLLTENQVTVQGNVLNIAFEEGQITDGVYQIEVLPTVTGLSGDPLDGDRDGIAGDSFVLTGDASNRLFRYLADWNGDGGASIFDFATFAYWFGQSLPTVPAYVDLSGDQGISIFDFGFFAGQFGRSVVFPSPAMYSPREHDDPVNGATASSRRAGHHVEHHIDAATRRHDTALLRVLAEWSKKTADAHRVWSKN